MRAGIQLAPDSADASRLCSKAKTYVDGFAQVIFSSNSSSINHIGVAGKRGYLHEFCVAAIMDGRTTSVYQGVTTVCAPQLPTVGLILISPTRYDSRESLPVIFIHDVRMDKVSHKTSQSLNRRH